MLIDPIRVNTAYKKIVSIVHKIGVSNIISALTLIITFSALYYQNIRISSDFKAILVSSLLYREGKFVSDIIFVNNGNRPCSVADITVECNGKYKSSVPSHSGASFTVKPNDIVSKKLVFDTEFKYAPPNPDVNELGLSFVVIDSSGACHQVNTGALMKNGERDGVQHTGTFPKVVTLLPSPKSVGEVIIYGSLQYLNE
jgi:hypothetical protein